jgi:hypothetical protein
LDISSLLPSKVDDDGCIGCNEARAKARIQIERAGQLHTKPIVGEYKAKVNSPGTPNSISSVIAASQPAASAGCRL